MRHLIEDLGALSHVYYIVTNVTRSFYDQIKIPGISRIRLKEEVFGSDEKINRFLYGIKEAVDSKQQPKSDCQYIFDKLNTYIKNESNYPIGYQFNYMKERKEEQKELNSLNELENVVRRETTKLVHVFLLAIMDFETSNDARNHSLKEKAFWSSILHNVDLIESNRTEMLLEPSLLDLSHSLIVVLRTALAEPRDNHNLMPLLLELVQLASERVHVQQNLSFTIRTNVLSNQIVKPTLNTVEISNRSIHVKADTHFFIPLFFLSKYKIHYNYEVGMNKL